MTRNRHLLIVRLFAVIAFLWTLPAAATESVTYEGQMGFGSAVPITGAIHFNIGPKPISLGAGLYELHVAAATNCHWRSTLVSTNQNAAGVQPIAMSELNLGKNTMRFTMTIGGKPFTARVWTSP
jgi:hypothetical protein